jgi:hypothetical protein
MKKDRDPQSTLSQGRRTDPGLKSEIRNLRPQKSMASTETSEAVPRLFEAGHLLWRPLGWLLWQLARVLQPAARAFEPLQLLSIVVSALGVGLAAVFFTVCLFLAGIGLVIKTRIRWGFFGLGSVGFLGATVYLLLIPWA